MLKSVCKIIIWSIVLDFALICFTNNLARYVSCALRSLWSLVYTCYLHDISHVCDIINNSNCRKGHLRCRYTICCITQIIIISSYVLETARMKSCKGIFSM